LNPYTHYTLALKLITLFEPADPDEFIWGSLVPDIRYLAGLPREQTHFSPDQLQGLLQNYPDLKSFLQGYQLHCFLDLIDVTQVVSQVFPYNFIRQVLRRKLSQPQISILIELYYLETAPKNPPHKLDLKKHYNEVLAKIGVCPSQADTFYLAMQEYISAPDFRSAFSLFQKIGVVKSIQGIKYLNAYQSIQKNGIFMKIMLNGIKKANLEQKSTWFIQAHLTAPGKTP
jgi:hypothetical protein